MTDEQISNINEIPNTFARYNTEIKDLSDLDKFSKLTSIGDDAFESCSGLTSLIIKAIIPLTINSNTFHNVNKSISIYVLSESVNTYKSTQYWSEFTNIQQVDV